MDTTSGSQELSRLKLYVCLAALVAYSSMIALPAFNDDDIIQGQPISGDSNNFLAQGRWGYYIIYKTLFDANPSGPFALVTGTILLVAAAYLAAKTLGLTRPQERALFALMGSVSLYYSSIFTFDSTRVAYPLSFLLAALSVALCFRRQWIAGVASAAIAMAIFQASVQVSLTLVAGAALAAHLSRRLPETWKTLSLTTLALGLSAGLYVVSTKLCARLTGIPLNGRSDIDVLGALGNFDRIEKLFLGHAFGQGYQLPYFTDPMKVLLPCILVLFLLAGLLARRTAGASVVTLLLSLLLSCAPFALAFVSARDEFSPRAVSGFVFVYATFAGLALAHFGAQGRRRLQIAVIALSLCYTGLSAIQINGQAYDEYLTSRNDILATNRIIYRIDEALAQDATLATAYEVPLIVRYDRPLSVAPRGLPATYRFAPWSREWIFRQIDPRFRPIMGSGRDAFESRLDSLPNWPAPGSVVIEQGVVLVRIN